MFRHRSHRVSVWLIVAGFQLLQDSADEGTGNLCVSSALPVNRRDDHGCSVAPLGRRR
jgi:hypothetical protein